MLPDGFRWQSIYGPAGPEPRDALACLGTEVARIDARIDGGWVATLRYADGHSVIRRCSSYEAGRAGCEAWAGRHQEELRVYARRRDLKWLANQTWRGTDAVAARRQLEPQ